MPEAARVVAHLDMDAFYASVELLRYPELRGRPVVVGGGQSHQPRVINDIATGNQRYEFARLGDYVGRGVATTATYEARSLGVHSALGLMKAARLAPNAILLPVDFPEYRKYSKLFKAAVTTVAPRIQDNGVDEIYIDLLSAAGVSTAMSDGDLWSAAIDAAKRIKDTVREATSLTCSIGVAHNKLLAKIASELEKPDGLTVVGPNDIPTRIWPLAARKINGVGPKTAARLEALGIHTIGELASADPARLIEHFGKSSGAWMHDAANGRDERPIVTVSEPVTISHETTFDRDLSATADRAELSAIFTELCEELAGDLQRKGYVGRTIGLKVRYSNFKTVTRDRTIPEPTQDATAIRRAAGDCLKRVPLERRIRLLGVRVSALRPVDSATVPSHVDAAERSAALFD